MAKEGAGRGRVVFEEEEEAADGGEEDGQSGSGRRQQTMSPRTVPSLEEVAKEVESHEVEFQPVESHRGVPHTRRFMCRILNHAVMPLLKDYQNHTFRKNPSKHANSLRKRQEYFSSLNEPKTYL